jgi:ligand-binding sensor domain-containing protein
MISSPYPNVLFYYDPKTTKIMPVQQFSPSFFPNVYADPAGRLWLGGLGWRDPDKITWYQLVPSPIFITNVQYEALAPMLQTPSVDLASSDGRVWFSSDNGMAWMDLQKEQWCWFTTYQSNIVEDAGHNLWMIADRKLYKNPLQP